MAKTRYSATFEGGAKITRGSERTYTHAWRAQATCEGKTFEETGFAGSYVLAFRAAQAFASGATGRASFNTATQAKKRRGATIEYYRWLAGEVKRNGGKEAWEARVREVEKTVEIEVVEAKVEA
jgi:hypothetical protein